MTDNPVNLDSHRSLDNQNDVAFRRHLSRTCSPDNLIIAPIRDAALQAHLLLGPADNWSDISCKVMFLLDRYATTSEAQDIRVKILIKRALCDIARLTRRKDRNR
jgi:hypothetical protein